MPAKIEDARKAGIIKEDITDINCIDHPKAKIVKINFYGWEGYSGYVCLDCMNSKLERRKWKREELKERLEKEGLNPEGLGICIEPLAYNCPTCGIVKGLPYSRLYRSPIETWQNMAGRKGIVYECRICREPIGAKWMSVS